MFLLFSQGGIFTDQSSPSTPLPPTPPQTLWDPGNPTVNDTTSWDVMGVGAAPFPVQQEPEGTGMWEDSSEPP